MTMTELLFDDTSYNAFKEFKDGVQEGLSEAHKYISSQFLYDERGSELFNDISRLDEYYLTKTEIDILKTYQTSISHVVGAEPFNMVDLGPGEGIKTQILIEAFLKNAGQFSYIPIDISMQYLKNINQKFLQKFPSLNITGIHADFFKGLEWLAHRSKKRNVVLFLGSSIGNFNPTATKQFLRHLKIVLKPDDLLLIGFDLCKNINLLMKAYNDSKGVTSTFNLNILQRINRELHAHFDLNKFQHYPNYNVYTHAMESYLISKEAQKISIDALGQTISFEAMEPIHIEYSYKYQLSQVQNFAKQTGFRILNNYFDENEFFLNSIWQVI